MCSFPGKEHCFTIGEIGAFRYQFLARKSTQKAAFSFRSRKRVFSWPDLLGSGPGSFDQFRGPQPTPVDRMVASSSWPLATSRKWKYRNKAPSFRRRVKTVTSVHRHDDGTMSQQCHVGHGAHRSQEGPPINSSGGLKSDFAEIPDMTIPYRV